MALARTNARKSTKEIRERKTNINDTVSNDHMDLEMLCIHEHKKQQQISEYFSLLLSLYQDKESRGSKIINHHTYK